MKSDSSTTAMPQRLLDVSQAAALLHLNVKRVQGLARAGKLPAVRLGRKWLFPREQLERMLGSSQGGRERAVLSISARNRLRGRITRISVEGLMAEICLAVGDQELVSVITRTAAERLVLRVGDEAFALIKSTEVMIGKEDTAE